jgi:hypothetical protein
MKMKQSMKMAEMANQWQRSCGSVIMAKIMAGINISNGEVAMSASIIS